MYCISIITFHLLFEPRCLLETDPLYSTLHHSHLSNIAADKMSHIVQNIYTFNMISAVKEKMFYKNICQMFYEFSKNKSFVVSVYFESSGHFFFTKYRPILLAAHMMLVTNSTHLMNSLTFYEAFTPIFVIENSMIL